MKRRVSLTLVSTAAVLLSVYGGHADDKLTALTYQDVPRGFLGELAARTTEPGSKGVGVPFYLPQSAKDGITYGIDISHYTFSNGASINWDELGSKKVSFVYIKASEGVSYYDGTFEGSWHSLGAMANGPVRGAYHFLRALDDPREQAVTFVNILKEKSDYKVGRDLPPVVDLEWDCKRDAKGRPIYKNGRCAHDNWSDLTPDEITSRVSSFLAQLKKELNVDALVYTSNVWWNERHLNDASDKTFLAANKLWIADYTKKSQKTSNPPIPAGLQSIMWQFTDNGKLTDTCNPSDKNSHCTDTNAVLMNFADFKRALGIADQQ
ncbi:glycoside hydrolase family 25 protein [Mesorhizobium sp. CA5]|uniref:glycoside hydrolase family 25 protein n=1 Tax=Mesorhizobium sp. CA5 TaxID=2876638 RepID=UPI001CD10EC0|nr:GH25 family lysozyme [Mesorhizobium sp. CA5]MBZ9845676.1 hypothetical protein [Mesorhizobium sp. CA5]